MNKIKSIILILLLTSCLIDELPYIYYQGYCDCVFWDIDAQEHKKLLLRPGTYEFGFSHDLKLYTRKEYCEIIFKGELANCKSE